MSPVAHGGAPDLISAASGKRFTATGNCHAGEGGAECRPSGQSALAGPGGLRLGWRGELIWDVRVMRKLLVTAGVLCSLAPPAVAQQPAGAPWSVAIQKEQPPGSWFLIIPKATGGGWVSAVYKSYEECRSAVAGPPRERTHKLLYEGTYWCTYAPH
jgi:hypothetical protein